MATIVERTRKDGSIAYVAQITRRAHTLQKSKTFPTRKAATAWAKKAEKEIDDAIAAGNDPSPATAKKITLGDAIDKYIHESMKEIGKTKAQVLRTIRTEYDIAEMRCEQIASQDIIAFAQELHQRPKLESKSTVLNYLSHLSAVFSIARPMWNFPLDKRAMDDAMAVCKSMGITSKSKKRNRRPTLAELDLLMHEFKRKHAHRPKSCPMHRIATFAIFSTRRQDEICRITWSDYEPDAKRVLVRDMKHPGDKEGNDTWVELPDPCPAIIEATPRTSDRIFPYTADAISAAFTRACKVLEIDDLHFHDLRHEGTSRLFEMGRTIPLAASVTGHRSWTSLQRYSHLRQTGDKYKNWPWIEKVCQ